MKKRPEWFKQGQTLAKDAKAGATAALREVGKKAEEQYNQLDQKYELTKRGGDIKAGAKKALHNMDDKFELRKAAETAKLNINRGIERVGELAKEKGLPERVTRLNEALKDSVVEPIVEFAEETGISKKWSKISKATAEQYGKTRALVKPYFAPETPDELLRDTKRELTYINACILQISQDEAEKLANKLGAAIVSKIAGAASVGALLGMVSTFGTASTGVAIAGLHGAAATSATFYWVGSMLGGGMATGAVLTGGVALAVGYSVYKLIGSEPRRLEDLSEAELQVVDATGFVIAAINDVLNDPTRKFKVNEAALLLQFTLRPLHQTLLENLDDICEHLDNKNSFLFRHHAIVDFKKSVLDGFEFFIQEENEARRRYPEYVIAGVLYALLTESAVDDSRESQLALGAIRRMKTEWNDASEAQLSADLAQYEPEQLQGIANNAKGIYHEMLFVDDYNKSHNDTYAELFGATNHPGADVQIKLSETDEVVKEFQLKATSTEGLVIEHLEKYPQIDVLATEEIAKKSGLVDSSGISNLEITVDMNQTLDDVADNTVFDRTEESAELAGLVAAGREAIRLLSGNQSVSEAGMNVVKAATVTATSTALVAFLFS